MADSIFGDVAQAAAGVVSSTLKDAPEGALKDMTEKVSEVLGPVMQSMSESGGALNADIAPLLESLDANARADVVDGTPESQADGAAPSGHAYEVTATEIEDVAGKIDALEESAMTKLQSSDPETARQGQVELQQAQQIMETMTRAIQERGDAEKQAIEGLRGDAGNDDGTVVAVADGGDAHMIVHADTDAGYDHATDYATDHATVAPAAAEAPGVEDDGVA